VSPRAVLISFFTKIDWPYLGNHASPGNSLRVPSGRYHQAHPNLIYYFGAKHFMTTLPYISPVSGNGNHVYDQKMTILQSFYFIRIKTLLNREKE
jgi:hypothetical protein